jgi:hypothetical protein
MMLRQAIVAEAALIAQEEDQLNSFERHHQVHRDRKYLYSFFGRDFIDELYAMESEFLLTENKLLGLHSMDAVSLHQALFVLALAKNDVRSRILERFQEMIRCDLTQAEFDFRRSSELRPHKTGFHLPHTSRQHREDKVLRQVCLNNAQRYHFRNLRNFFAASSMLEADTMNPLQREFIKLAQIFKARLVTEMDLKQRVIERAMIEDDREFDLLAEEEAANSIRATALLVSRNAQAQRFAAATSLSDVKGTAQFEIARVLAPIMKEVDALNFVKPLATAGVNYARAKTPMTLQAFNDEANTFKYKIEHHASTKELVLPESIETTYKAIAAADPTNSDGELYKALTAFNVSVFEYEIDLDARRIPLESFQTAVISFLDAADPVELDMEEY